MVCHTGDAAAAAHPCHMSATAAAKATAAAAAAWRATAVTSLAGLLSASGAPAAAAGQQPVPTGTAPPQAAAGAGGGDMQVLLRQSAEMAQVAWTLAEQLPDSAADLVEVMACPMCSCTNMNDTAQLPPFSPWSLLHHAPSSRGCLGRAGSVFKADVGPAVRRRAAAKSWLRSRRRRAAAIGGCTRLRGRAAARSCDRCSDRGTDCRRLEPVFHQVVTIIRDTP